MYACPNCASNLKFSIEKQALFCEACDTVVSPYDVVKDKDADESSVYEVNIFTCPQCGGEIVTEDNEAAAFCSYCGGSTILDSRLSTMQRPAYIIPFKKTKKDCVESYKKYVKHCIFAPKNMKEVANINSFRGIYMPFWTYACSRSGPIDVEGTRSYRRGDYVFTDHYQISSNLNSSYAGVSFDASSTFSDDLSEAIEPYDQSQMLQFTPSFLSGFYADASDVPPQAYDGEVRKLVDSDCTDKLLSDQIYRSYTIKKDSVEKKMNHNINRADLTMLPVWFMSYRVKDRGEDRITYSVVNGQTGKLTGDIPIDFKKYIIFSLILSGGVFAILYFLLGLNISRKIALVTAAAFSILVSVLRGRHIKNTAIHETGSDDLGVLFQNRLKFEKDNGADDEEAMNNAIRKSVSIGKSKDKVIYHSNAKFFGIFTSVVAGLIYFINPNRDSIWYIADTVILLLSILQIILMMASFNRLTTRKLPQFDRTGGDDSAKIR